MAREGKTSITVHQETFDRLSDRKPDGVTWDYLLDQSTAMWYREHGDE